MHVPDRKQDDASDLTALRRAKDLTLAQVGALCGVVESAVSKWERGQQEPRGEQRASYAAALGISIERLGEIVYRRWAARGAADGLTAPDTAEPAHAGADVPAGAPASSNESTTCNE